MDVVTYALCKKYVEKTAIGLGAVKGAPCTIKSTEESPDGKSIIVTFEWVATVDPLVKETTQITIRQGNVVEVTPLLNKGTKIAEITVDGQKKDIYAPNGGGGSAELTDDLDVTRTVGGISSGDHYDTGTSLEDILRDMLNPVDYPTLTNPSASLSATGAKLLEKGATLNTTMTVTFSRGSINPAYGTSGYRSGPATGYSLNGGTSQAGNTFSVTITEALLSYRANAEYSAGEQPKDSTGKDYSSPLPAGSVNTNTITYEFVDALYANTSAAATMTKQALVSKSAGSKQLSIVATTAANPEQIDVPGSWTVSKIEVLNTLSGKWEDATSQFTKITTSHDDAAGNPVSYNRYTCNLGMALGARDIKISWS